MAPDSSLWRHHLGRDRSCFQSILLKVVVLSVVSLLTSTLNAQARADKSEPPETLLALSMSRDTQKLDLSASSATLSSPPETLKGTPAVLWRNRIQIPIHEPLIQKYIRFYQGQGRKTFSDASEKAEKFVPKMTEILESFGVPGEMVSVVFIESRFERNASYRGAGGYWQMLASTARQMGLRVDKYVDERRDPIKSTKAAAKYLKTLYDQHDSWLLALAAYNAGSRPIACAGRNSRVKDEGLYGHRLPARSMVYVSKVLAVMSILQEPEKHGFVSPKYCKPKDFDPVLVKTPLKLEEIAKWIDVPVSQLQDLNPSLNQDVMPPDSGFALRLPSGSRDKFELAYARHIGR